MGCTCKCVAFSSSRAWFVAFVMASFRNRLSLETCDECHSILGELGFHRAFACAHAKCQHVFAVARTMQHHIDNIWCEPAAHQSNMCQCHHAYRQPSHHLLCNDPRASQHRGGIRVLATCQGNGIGFRREGGRIRDGSKPPLDASTTSAAASLTVRVQAPAHLHQVRTPALSLPPRRRARPARRWRSTARWAFRPGASRKHRRRNWPHCGWGGQCRQASTCSGMP